MLDNPLQAAGWDVDLTAAAQPWRGVGAYALFLHRTADDQVHSGLGHG